MSDYESTDGLIENPYKDQDTLNDQDPSIISKRDKHGPRRDYVWYCSFQNMDAAEKSLKGLNCSALCFMCIFSIVSGPTINRQRPI